MPHHHSRVIFWLLLAATLCVDVVAVSWSRMVTLQHSETVYFGLIWGQLGLICIWASCASRGFWRWLAPFAFSLAASSWAGFVTGKTGKISEQPAEIAIIYFAHSATQAAVLLIVLWFISQTSFGQKLRVHPAAGRWRFSVKQLLAFMTAFAILIMI